MAQDADDAGVGRKGAGLGLGRGGWRRGDGRDAPRGGQVGGRGPAQIRVRDDPAPAHRDAARPDGLARRGHDRLVLVGGDPAPSVRQAEVVPGVRAPHNGIVVDLVLVQVPARPVEHLGHPPGSGAGAGVPPSGREAGAHDAPRRSLPHHGLLEG